MNTFQTIETAREHAAKLHLGLSSRIIKIEHVSQGECFICVKASLEFFRRSIDKSPVAEIVRLIAEYPIRSDEQIAAERQEQLASDCHCDRCNLKIDGNTCYNQQEWDRVGGKKVPVTAYYCNKCEAFLNTIGAGERTEMQSRASHVSPQEPSHKSDV